MASKAAGPQYRTTLGEIGAPSSAGGGGVALLGRCVSLAGSVCFHLVLRSVLEVWSSLLRSSSVLAYGLLWR